VVQPVSQGGGGKQFAFIRSSRGGTTGTYNEHTTQGTLSHRYDDFAFEYNITNAKAVGILAGPYHFGRPDILSYQIGGNTIAHTGTDEANHMLEQAGAYMRPGYLRPVFDLEAGDVQRTTEDLTNFALDFANRIYEVKGIYPLVYINSYYANTQVDSRITLMDLWIARWPNQANPDQIDLNGDPPAASTYPNVYGVWNPIYPQIPDPTPWKFWQYTSNGHVPGIGNGTTDRVDLNVAHGDLEYVKDFLVPALWKVDASGQWTTASNWNGNPDLPAPIDRVIIDRPAGDFLITLGAGSHSIRSLASAERFHFSGGSLVVQQYAHFTNSSTFSGGQLQSGSIQNNALLNVTGGSIATGAVRGSGSVSVTSGQITADSIRQASLHVGGTGRVRVNPNSGSMGTSTLGAISISGSGQFDLATNALVIDYTGGSPILLTKALIVLGHAGGAWDGPGITSSEAAANPGYGIGFAEKSDLTTVPPIFGPTDSTSVLVRYTRIGDADLSGTVGLSDFNALAVHFGSTDAFWHEGDFNYDGLVNLIDFNLLASHFGLSAGPDGVVDPEDWSALASVVPEPSSLALVLLLLSPLVAPQTRCRGRR
jgi:GH25 family lysozyme M1 (1,4-beta-N-acetylmuramidase)